MSDSKSPKEKRSATLAGASQLLSVTTGDGKYVSPPSNVDAMHQLKIALHKSLGSVPSKMGMRPVTVRLALFGVVNSSAGAALAWSAVVQPDLFTDWASYAGVYDECKVIGTSVHYVVEFAQGTAGFAGQYAVTVYDPVSSTALTSIADGCTFSQHQLRNFAISTFSGGGKSPMAFTPTGYFSFRPTIPHSADNVLTSTGDTTQAGGQWFSTLDTGRTAGYIKGYIPALGTGVISAVRLVHYVTCEFRMRR